METVTYEVGGMSCQGCVTNLTNALQKVDGIGELQVEVGQAVIEHDGVLPQKRWKLRLLEQDLRLVNPNSTGEMVQFGANLHTIRCGA